jgi:hypothetical protein
VAALRRLSLHSHSLKSQGPSKDACLELYSLTSKLEQDTFAGTKASHIGTYKSMRDDQN